MVSRAAFGVYCRCMGTVSERESVSPGVPLCRVEEIPAEQRMRSCAVGGKEYLVTLDDGDVRVYQQRCPHRGGPLSQGTLRDGVVTCPWHRARFDVQSGKLVSGPEVGPNVPLLRKCLALFVRNLRAYPSVVRDGTVVLHKQ